jgi:hypothetical protein
MISFRYVTDVGAQVGHAKARPLLGFRLGYNREGTCEACGGMKEKPSRVGQVILDFLEKSQPFHRFR